MLEIALHGVSGQPAKPIENNQLTGQTVPREWRWNQLKGAQLPLAMLSQCEKVDPFISPHSPEHNTTQERSAKRAPLKQRYVVAL